MYVCIYTYISIYYHTYFIYTYIVIIKLCTIRVSVADGSKFRIYTVVDVGKLSTVYVNWRVLR